MTPTKPKGKQMVIIGLLLLLSFGAGVLFDALFFSKNNEGGVMEVREKGYAFISPLLDYQSIQETKQAQIIDLKIEIEDYINKQKEKGNLTDASVYLRELNNGPWLGINEKAGFSPASLLKVPILIAILKRAEQSPELLNQKVTNEPIDDGLIQEIVPSNPLKEGEKYSIWELVTHMILYSDNRAKNLLLVSFKDEDFNRVYADFGIKTPSINEPEDFMSVRNYAAFFRILYNASYLNKTMSNKALELLSKIEYNKGIVGGLPDGIVVSHKFGERTLGEVKQLHDCGIIYYPKNPTLLCIMTRGHDWANLEESIQTITRITHESISKDKVK